MAKEAKAGRRSAGGELLKALEKIDPRCPFGPLFFLQQLKGFVRDRCPDQAEGLPVVELHLADGEVLDVCHIMGVAPLWLALASYDTEKASDKPPMRTEIVPYSMISRVRIRSSRHDLPHIGFETGHEPNVLAAPVERAAMSPEETLRALSGATPIGWRKPR